MNKVFAGVSCLLFTSLDPRFESRFHAKDNIYDTASSGYNTILGDEYKAFSSLLCNLLHSPVISCLLGPNILLNTMFSLSFLSSRSVNDQERCYHYRSDYKATEAASTCSNCADPGVLSSLIAHSCAASVIHYRRTSEVTSLRVTPSGTDRISSIGICIWFQSMNHVRTRNVLRMCQVAVILWRRTRSWR